MRVEWTEQDGKLFTFHNGIRIERFADQFIVHIVDSKLLPTGKTQTVVNLKAAYRLIDNGGAKDNSFVRPNAENDRNDKMRDEISHILGHLDFTDFVDNVELLSPSELREFQRALNQFTSVFSRFDNRLHNRRGNENV